MKTCKSKQSKKFTFDYSLKKISDCLSLHILLKTRVRDH